MSGNNKIKNAFENIEPVEGAKERMLANIKRKSMERIETSAPQKKSLPFSDIVKWAAPIAACLVIALVGVKVIPSLVTSSEPPDVLGGNPFVTVDSAYEFEKQLGISIEAPSGASEVEYVIIDGEIAHIDFHYNAHSYNLRASQQSGDFSGLNGIETNVEQFESENNAALITICGVEATYLKLTWTDGKVNYILSNTDGGSADEIKEIYALVK